MGERASTLFFKGAFKELHFARVSVLKPDQLTQVNPFDAFPTDPCRSYQIKIQKILETHTIWWPRAAQTQKTSKVSFSLFFGSKEKWAMSISAIMIIMLQWSKLLVCWRQCKDEQWQSNQGGIIESRKKAFLFLFWFSVATTRLNLLGQDVPWPRSSRKRHCQIYRERRHTTESIETEVA